MELTEFSFFGYCVQVSISHGSVRAYRCFQMGLCAFSRLRALSPFHCTNKPVA